MGAVCLKDLNKVPRPGEAEQISIEVSGLQYLF